MVIILVVVVRCIRGRAVTVMQRCCRWIVMVGGGMIGRRLFHRGVSLRLWIIGGTVNRLLFKSLRSGRNNLVAGTVIVIRRLILARPPLVIPCWCGDGVIVFR